MAVQPLGALDRLQLVSLLEGADDFPAGMARWYLNAKAPHVDLIAWTGDSIDGVITGTFGADYRSNDAFDSLDLPAGPHAFLTRIYVKRAARRAGVGLDLLEAFANEARARHCTYIAGVLDQSSSPNEREAFFETAGFVFTQDDMIGAGTIDLLERIAGLRR